MKTHAKKLHGLVFHLLYLVFLASLVFPFRAITSISIGVLLLAGILMNAPARQTLFQSKIRNLFLAGCALYLLLQIVAMLYTSNSGQGWSNSQMKAGMLLVPLAVCLSLPDATTRKKLLRQFCLVLLVASLYCLLVSFLQFRQSGHASVFFYHELAKPIRQHAVYFSILNIIGIIFLLETLAKDTPFINRTFTICLTIYLSVFLVMLSSKFAIAFYLFYLVCYFAGLLQKAKGKPFAIAAVFILLATATTLVFATKNPVKERFSDIFRGDLSIITQDKFDQGDYFNGLQFRLLQWRFVAEILTEKSRWWIGVSPGDAQTALNAKYLSKNMYAGDPSRGDRGYLAYNTHNQFLEALLQNGIAGLLAVLLICFSLTLVMFRDKHRLTVFIILLLLGWLLTEAVFETQYGIMIFTFFPLFVSGDIILEPGEKPTF